MGTSSSYDAPPSWGSLKSLVTRTAGTGPASAARLVGDYVGKVGGAAAIARRGSGGRGGSAGRQAARGLAGFTSRVAAVGLPEALREAGLDHLIGQPVGKLVQGLIDRFCGPGSTFDQVDARNAMSRLTETLLDQAETPEQVGEILTGIVEQDRLGSVLVEYFGYLLYEEFMRSFYEQVLQRHGEERVDSMTEDILDFILKAVENQAVDVDLTTVNWFGAEGRRVAQQVMEQTLRVFGG